jgi:hypothetical protein
MFDYRRVDLVRICEESSDPNSFKEKRRKRRRPIVHDSFFVVASDGSFSF